MTNAEHAAAVENAVSSFLIPVQNRGVLEAKLTKLQKRAQKLELLKISWTWGEEVTIDRTLDDGRRVGTLWVNISVSTERPCFAGWEFLGVLNHTDVPGQILRKMIPGIPAPVEAVNAVAGQCDHCQKARARLETFVVRHEEDGRVKIVGRNCLADFLGHASPAQLAGSLSYVLDVFGACEDAGEGGGGGKWVFAEKTLHLLALSCLLCRLDGGFKPRAFEERATATVLGQLVWPSKRPEEQRASEEFHRQLTLADCERAWAALSWLADVRDGNDFIHNIRIIAGAGSTTAKNLGLLCAIVPAFDREAGRRVVKPAIESAHVGEVGARADFGRGVVERCFSFDNQWGGGTLVIIRLTSGAVLKWAASRTDQWVVPGVTVEVAGTVKRHAEYKGTPQTEISRAKLQQVVAA